MALFCGIQGDLLGQLLLQGSVSGVRPTGTTATVGFDVLKAGGGPTGTTTTAGFNVSKSGGRPTGTTAAADSMCQNLVVDPQEQPLLQGPMWLVVDPQGQAPMQDSSFTRKTCGYN